ncbi:MAG: hypothetical protein ACJ8LG_16640 [Massilia sp.]
MRSPTASELLQAWEEGAGRGVAERALSLLALALPDAGLAALARCSVGVRDDLLLGLRERLFGAQLDSVAQCPACGATLETQWRAGALRLPAPPLPDSGELRLAALAHELAFRLPSAEDLVAIEHCADADGARALLLGRCLRAASANGAPVAAADLPDEVVAALEAAMAAADPMAEIDIGLECPACGHGWSLAFDIARFLWTEIDSWAQRLLVDVHRLARAYGWREADILAMSAGRRQLYLQMSGA